MHRLERAVDRGAAFLRKAAVGVLDLAHHCRAQRPAVVELDPQRDARAVGVDIVVIVLDQIGVVLGNARGGIGAAARDIVDIAAVAAIPCDHAQRRGVRNPRVVEPFGDPAEITAMDAVQLEIHRAVAVLGVGRIGDHLDRARHRACAVKRALRPGQRLDPRKVIGVDIQRALDRGDRHFVEIDPDRGERGGVVRVLAAGDTAEIDLAEARPCGLHRDRRQELGDIAQFVDLQFAQRLGAQCGDRDRHVLQVLRTLLRSDDDDVAVVGGAVLRGERHR